MRELTVYYCPGCGHYGFHHISGNTICPVCQKPMEPLPMSYQNFMNLEYDMRDKIIANQIAGDVIPSSSVVQRITALEKGYDSRFATAALKAKIEELTEEHEKLAAENDALRGKIEEQSHTIDWMHDMIWDLTNRLHGKK